MRITGCDKITVVTGRTGNGFDCCGLAVRIRVDFPDGVYKPEIVKLRGFPRSAHIPIVWTYFVVRN